MPRFLTFRDKRLSFITVHNYDILEYSTVFVGVGVTVCVRTCTYYGSSHKVEDEKSTVSDMLPPISNLTQTNNVSSYVGVFSCKYSFKTTLHKEMEMHKIKSLRLLV